MIDHVTARILPFPRPPYAEDRESPAHDAQSQNAPLSVVLDADRAVLDPAVALARRRLTIRRALRLCRRVESQRTQSATQARRGPGDFAITTYTGPLPQKLDDKPLGSLLHDWTLRQNQEEHA